MSMRRFARIFALLTVAGVAGPAAWAAAQREAVLGSKGELYVAKAGSYGQLFPGGKETAPTNPVLALDVTRADGKEERLLVEGTQGPDVEKLPFLFFEEASETLYLVWERSTTLIHPSLMLSGYDGSWLTPFEIIGNPLAPKASPQLAVTRDSYEEEGEDGPVTHHRTILHLVWREENGSGVSETFYTPIFLEDGTFLGRSPVYRLVDFDTGVTAELAPAALPQVALVSKVQRGRDERTLVVAFTSPATGRLAILEIDALPAQLSRLAGEARGHIIDLGAKLFPAKIQSLAQETRSHVMKHGGSFHPEVVQSLADQVQAFILAQGSVPGSTLKVIADGARGHIIDLGAKLSGRGLRSATLASSTVANTVEIQSSDLEASSEVSAFLPQLLQIRVASSRPVPPVGSSEIAVFMTERGQDVIVAWVDGNRVLYRESAGEGWKDTLEIKLSPSLDLARAYEILEQRVKNR
jgi:hypothetical protein